MIDTKALGPSTLGSGRLSNFSISGKVTSMASERVLAAWVIRPGRRCRVWGPNTTST